MRIITRLAVLGLVAVALSARPASAALKVVATTADLAAITSEVGGTKVQVDALAKGYQDPHFVEPKPSFILLVSRADLLVAVGRRDGRARVNQRIDHFGQSQFAGLVKGAGVGPALRIHARPFCDGIPDAGDDLSLALLRIDLDARGRRWGGRVFLLLPVPGI